MLTTDDLNKIAYLLGENEKKIERKIDEAKEETIRTVAEFVVDSVLPLIEKADARIEKLEHHTSHPPASPTS